MDIKTAFANIFNMPNFPRVRAEDPVTSFQAAEEIKPVIREHYQIIVGCLIKYGPLGKDGIAHHTKLDGSQIARRLNEMKVIGLIKLTGNSVKSEAGRNEREWTV